LSLWTKKKDRERYCEDIVGCDEIKIAPMLAQNITKNWKIVESQFMQGNPVYVSPKLDGHRLMVHVFQNDNGVIELEYYSKKLVKTDTLHHLDDSIKDFINNVGWDLPVHLDGEAYIHGVSLEILSSYIKRIQPETNQIKYQVYDVYLSASNQLDFSQRFIKPITNLNPISQSESFTRDVPSVPCYSTEEIKDLLKGFEEKGYEGAMVRINKPYEQGVKSKYLLKFKTFQDSEYKIVGYSYGKDRYEGCVIWKCITEKNVEFDILAHGTLKEKKVQNPETYIGRYVTIKYKDTTDAGIPKPAVIKCFREDF
jgi:DNA ligase-1